MLVVIKLTEILLDIFAGASDTTLSLVVLYVGLSTQLCGRKQLMFGIQE